MGSLGERPERKLEGRGKTGIVPAWASSLRRLPHLAMLAGAAGTGQESAT